MILKKVRYLFVVLCLLFDQIILAQNIVLQSQEIAHLLQKNKLNKVYSKLSPEFQQSFSKRKFKTSWKQLVKTNGNIQSIKRSDTINATSTSTIVVLEKLMLNLLVSSDGSGKISGFGLRPLSYAPPKESQNKIYGKERVIIKTDTFSMKGELTFPIDCDQCPLVILVHGSGCSDMDESAYALAPFKDLALTLSNQGIATLRYNKRCNEYPASISKKEAWTLQDETINDALSAVRLSKNFSQIDTNRIYVLGHSLGAFAAPRIAEMDTTLAGIILLAGPSRPLYEVLEQQITESIMKDDKMSILEKKFRKPVDEEINKLRSKNFDQIDEIKYMAYWPKSFFVDLADYNPIESCKNLNCRILITQGDRDFQVSYIYDFQPFANELEPYDHIECTLFRGLNHFYVWGEEESDITEYFYPSNVDSDFMEYLGNWILEQK
ncbi:MAG: pimeloyl-ACP methyl ester carboxylesterase [Bacteroidia bacterium]|jgi:pimeloyl-ACP methyl ester carboxylesterase